MKWLIGLAASAAAVYFLKTEKGRALAESLKKEGGSLGESLFKMAGDLLKKGTPFAGQVADRAKSAVL